MNKVNMIHPSLVEAGLKSVGIDDVTVTDDGEGGFTLSYKQDFTIEQLLNKLAEIGMEKYVLDTMVMPSNASRLRSVAADIESYMLDGQIDAETREALDEAVMSMLGVADNLCREEGR